LTGPSPVDRARTGSKHHLITDSAGVPLAISLTGGNRNDVTQLLPLIDGIGPVAGKVGRPRKRAERLLADRGNAPDGVEPILREARTGLVRQEVRLHTEMQVGGVNELNHHGGREYLTLEPEQMLRFRETRRFRS